MQTFYGPWDVRVLSKDADFSQRIVITGSDASDGIYDGTAGGGPGRVDGARWTLHAEWNDNVSSGWQTSALRETAQYTLADGFTVTIGIDDNSDAVRDHDYDDVVVLARSLDPTHTPLHPVAAPLDFTVTEDAWWQYWESADRDPDHPYRGYPPPVDGPDPVDPRNPRDPRDPRDPIDRPRRPLPPRPPLPDLDFPPRPPRRPR